MSLCFVRIMFEHLQRYGKHNCRVLFRNSKNNIFVNFEKGKKKCAANYFFGGNVRQSLQVSQLKSNRTLADNIGGRFQRHRCLLLALGRDHLGTCLTTRLGLGGHRSLHLHGQPHVLALEGTEKNLKLTAKFINF